MEHLAAAFLARLIDPVTAIVAVGLAAWLPRWWGILLAGVAGGALVLVWPVAAHELAPDNLGDHAALIEDQQAMAAAEARILAEAASRLGFPDREPDRPPPSGGRWVAPGPSAVMATPARRAEAAAQLDRRLAAEAAAANLRQANLFAGVLAGLAWALGIAILRWSLRKKPV